MKKVFMDIECYSNYFLICFKTKSKTRFYELYEGYKLDITSISKIMNKYLTIGFNSIAYDLPMLVYALKGATTQKLKQLSDLIINSKLSRTKLFKMFDISIPFNWDHIDIIEPAPSVGVGLKMYGARMHTRTLQDLPIEPDAIIDDSEHELLRKYCANDTAITMELYNKIEERIVLREKISKAYKIDLRSKSDAQIAENIIKKSLGVISSFINIDVNKIYKYIPPKFINFKTDELKSFLKNVKTIDFHCNEKGSLIKESTLTKHVTIKDIKFSVGIGGLHSNEKHLAVTASDNEFLIDIDVASYYPSIILNNKYYPEQIGTGFLTLYEYFYNQRIEAKQNKDTIKAETYKIILNGSFGKFGSKYSILYSPSLLLHTTLTGQLSLLMLIERLALHGFDVISANTDGITIKGLKTNYDKFNRILTKWEEVTNFKLEKVAYKATYHESVNSYIAITEDNTVKCKGVYALEGLNKNPVSQICIDAVISYFKENKSIESTIHQNQKDIIKYLVIRKVSGGAIYKNNYLGKIIRWYYSTDGDCITYKKNGNKVATSDGAKPLMILDGKPILDLDLNRYVEKSYKMLRNLGIQEYINTEIC
jgi:hypothetical protein